MKTVKAKAPTRIDIAGGTLDLWPLHHIVNYKCTVNAGISLYAFVEISQSQDEYYHIYSLDQNQKCEGSFSEVCEAKSLELISVIYRNQGSKLECAELFNIKLSTVF